MTELMLRGEQTLGDAGSDAPLERVLETRGGDALHQGVRREERAARPPLARTPGR